MELKKHTSKICIFLINSFLITLAVLIIRDKNKDRFTFESEDETDIVPVNSEIIELQGVVATNRENKLRDLNSSPKEIKQNIITTTKTTTTTTPSGGSNGSTKTS